MRFICQIELTPDLFPEAAGKIAYIFMTDDDEYVDGTWEPFGGENAVIVQPNGHTDALCEPNLIGPTLRRYVQVAGKQKLQPIEVELGVDCEEGDDPEFIPESTRFELSKEDRERYSAQLNSNKIGGTPGFLQGDEFPGSPREWNLILQLDSCCVPFDVNFGDAGIAYAFLNKDATQGRFF